MLVHYNAAHTGLRFGDEERAATEYKKFLAEAIHRVANARARAGELDSADHAFEEAMAFAGDDPNLKLDYAAVLFDQNRPHEARPMAESVLKTDPKNQRALILLGRMCFQEKDYPAAKDYLEQAAAAGQFFNDVWRLLSLSYLRLGRPELAKTTLNEVLQILGETPRNHVLIATIYYYGDFPDLAVQELSQTLAQDPNAPDAHYYLGLAYLANNEAAGYPKAVPEFRAQLTTDPKDYRSHYMLGYIALQRHQFENAEVELLQAAKLNSHDAGTKLLLGQLYLETHRPQQAENVLREIATISANTAPEAINVRAHYMLGRLLQRQGNLKAGTDEIAVAEKLRKELRLNSAETYGTRLSSLSAVRATTGDASPVAPRPINANAEERERAINFVTHVAQLIAEAYYNLAKIASLHEDSATAAQYSARAVAWDPSLASSAGR